MPICDFKEDPYLSLLRPLVEAYLAFYRVGNRHIQSLGLTPGQFEVLAELDGTKGLTCAQLSSQTLTTKGTLTGVLDRLEQRGLIRRGNVGGDRRATKVELTKRGTDMIERVFPVHAEFMRPFFIQALKVSEVQVTKQFLRRIRDSFEGGLNEMGKGLIQKGDLSAPVSALMASNRSRRYRRTTSQKKDQKQ